MKAPPPPAPYGEGVTHGVPRRRPTAPSPLPRFPSGHPSTERPRVPPAPPPAPLRPPQGQQLLEERGERSPLEHDSLMPSDEASDPSPRPWGAPAQRGSRHLDDDEEAYGGPYPDLYQPHRHHNSGLHGPPSAPAAAQERLLDRDPDRNWQRSRPWAKDSY